MKKLVCLTRVFTFGMAVLSIPALALAQPTFVELGNTGQIVDDGASIAIPVKVACTDDTTSASLVVGVAQRVDREFAGGNGRQDIEDCSSTSQTVQVLVTPNTNTRFREGTARARANLFACDEFNCSLLQDSEAIQLIK